LTSDLCSISLWERVRVRAYGAVTPFLTPALSQGEKAERQNFFDDCSGFLLPGERKKLTTSSWG